MRYHGCLSAIALSAVLLSAGCSRAPADNVIAAQIKARFFSDPLVKTSAVSVTVNRGDVTLAGAVSGVDMELQALKLAMETEGVRKLNDKMLVIPPPEMPKTIAQAPAPRHRESPAVAFTPPAEPAQEPSPRDQAQAVPEIARAPAPSPTSSSPTSLRVEVVRPRPVVAPAPAEPAPEYATVIAAPVVGTVTPSTAEPGGAHFQAPVVLLATGPVPPAALFEKWSVRLRQVDPHTRIEYQANGPIGGPQQWRQQTADVGVFDLPISDELLSQALNLRVLRFPAAVGGVVPICNIGGTLQALNFSGEVLAAVFSGRTVRWDDLGIRILNPQSIMPASQITVIHRSDASDETWLRIPNRQSPVAGSVGTPLGSEEEGCHEVVSPVDADPGPD